MSRISRNELLYEGCYAHVISRSIRKMRLFVEDEDFDQFKKLLRMAKKAGGFEVYHYCLMQTHFHLAGNKRARHFWKGQVAMDRKRRGIPGTQYIIMEGQVAKRKGQTSTSDINQKVD